MSYENDFDDLPVRDLDDDTQATTRAELTAVSRDADGTFGVAFFPDQPVLGQHEEQQTCPHCGKTFTVLRPRWYCSPACKKAAYRSRKER